MSHGVRLNNSNARGFLDGRLVKKKNADLIPHAKTIIITLPLRYKWGAVM